MQYITKEKKASICTMSWASEVIKEIFHVRSNVLNEHIIKSDKIIAGKKKSTDDYLLSKVSIILNFNYSFCIIADIWYANINIQY